MESILNKITPVTTLTEAELRGKRVLVRVDFNVQVYEGKILDDLRIRKTLPTIAFLRKNGAKVILVSHIESKDGTGLLPVAKHIQETYADTFGDLTFVPDILGIDAYESCKNMTEGQVVLFENLRVHKQEKENDPEFSKTLSQYAELYVNDAFAVSHRAHASVVGVPAYFPNARYAGIQLMNELKNLQVAFNPPHPFVFILGGAKFDTKLPLIQKFSEHADSIYLGGALLNDILKAKGHSVGASLVSSGDFDVTAVSNNPKLVIPTDVVVERGAGRELVLVENVLPDDKIMDVGPSLTEKLKSDLLTAKFVLWNGPMGNYEKGYKEQTIEMAKEIYASGVSTALGGGDTTAAIAELGYEDSEGGAVFVSTGGGAMLEYLENETLPGVEALTN